MTMVATIMRSAIVIAGLCAFGVSAAAADSVTLRGSTIPLREVRIEAIRAGELYYFDRGNQLHRRGLDEVVRLGFDGLPELDEAEVALEEGDGRAALLKYLQALVKVSADNDLQRLWLHVRLSQWHEAREEYVPAAGHAAAVAIIEPHAFWRVLEPTCPPVEPQFAQALEAEELLREAIRRVRDQSLRDALSRMLSVVQPIRVKLEETYNGPPIGQNSTWSGYSRKRIAEGDIFSGAPAVNAQPIETPRNDAPAEVAGTITPVPVPAEQSASERSIDRAAEEIDALLAGDDFAGALDRCEASGRNVAGRDIARLLHQWGRALAGMGRPHDAAVMFTRCAVLFPGSTHGLESLVETAMLYETVYKKPETAQRLLRRVIDQATLQGREAIARRARGLLR